MSSKQGKENWNTNPDENLNFCLAPWTHTFVSPQTERRLCCASREQSQFVHQYNDQPGGPGVSYQPKTLEQHWNSDFMKEVRLKMLNGIEVPECTICQNKTLHLNTYKDYFTKALFPHVQKEVIEKTNLDGSTSLEVRSFDYRLTNICDFKCRMCGDQLSSAWEAEKRKYNEWSPEYDPWMITENKALIESFQDKVIYKELEKAIEQGRLEEIYWVGGEPLIWDEHWKLMQRLVELGHADKVMCRYNTNLSRIQYKGVHLFDDLLKNVKSYSVCASIDAAGPVGEWIRTGLVWDKWVQNFKEGIKYQSERGPDSMVMDVTITLPGLFGLKPLFDLALELNSKMYVKLVFAFDPEKVLSPFVLPRDILHEVIDDLISYIEPKVTPRQQVLLDTLKEIKNRPTFQEVWPEDWKRGFLEGRKYMRNIGERRGDGKNGKLSLEQILSNNPKVLEWWESIE